MVHSTEEDVESPSGSFRLREQPLTHVPLQQLRQRLPHLEVEHDAVWVHRPFGPFRAREARGPPLLQLLQDQPLRELPLTQDLGALLGENVPQQRSLGLPIRLLYYDPLERP